MHLFSAENSKRILAVIVLTLGVGVIVVIFWKHEVKYALPTPVPVDYTPVLVGESIALPPSLKPNWSYFLHFYNPDCPCSRFNAKHIRTLTGNYRDSIRFLIVVPTTAALLVAKDELGADLSFIVDDNKSIANACGVYSTPQAAIIAQDGKLFYRGNYNRTRYCTTRASNFAELSLIALLNDQHPPTFGLLATQSYGCELNSNREELEFF